VATTYTLIPVAADQAEGASGTTEFTFRLVRSGDLPSESLAWLVEGFGAQPADASDFGGVLPAGGIDFLAGETEQLITFSVSADATIEPDEGFLLKVGIPSDSIPITIIFPLATADGIIRNDDFNVIPNPTAGADDLTGTAGDDAFVNMIGADTARGLGGNDHYVIADGRLDIKTLIEGAGGGDADEVVLAAALAGNVVALGASLPANIERLAIDAALAGVTLADQAGVANNWTFGFAMDATNGDRLGAIDAGAGDDIVTFATAIPNILLPPNPIFPGDPIRILLGSGNDQLTVAALASPDIALRTIDIDAGDGNDIVTIGFPDNPAVPLLHPTDPVKVLLGDGDDTLTLNVTYPAGYAIDLGRAEVFGDAGNDTMDISLNGIAWRSFGGAGNDTINLSVGVEPAVQTAASAGAGYDEVGGEAHGGAGNDLLNGSAHADKLFGDDGDDGIEAGGGDDVIEGGRGTDAVDAGYGNDLIKATINDGNDFYFGGGGSDTIDYSALTHRVEVRLDSPFGEEPGTSHGSKTGFDSLTSIENVIGSQAGDKIVGNGLNNMIDGSGGNDQLTGGGGDDTLVFAPGFGRDIVTDFDADSASGQDLLDISAFGITAADFAARIAISDLGVHTLITIDGDPNQTIRLLGVDAAIVTQDDFVFLTVDVIE
jgi:Ca2+-binding RTX toxin-like protein